MLSQVMVVAAPRTKKLMSVLEDLPSSIKLIMSMCVRNRAGPSEEGGWQGLLQVELHR